jgi:hypothetical protein
MPIREHVRPDNREEREFSIGAQFRTVTRLATVTGDIPGIGEIGIVTDIILRTASPYALVVLSFPVSDSVVHLHPSSMTPDVVKRVQR